ncbi:hypothetical protein [Roseateles violae]|uniref:Uncharacterized protein n=1 Tax=Roseateles violae TaxID=3058042 RepID=A0ABT8DWE8_9BURK|nr:hypothetical protein [Pelomonas sp. PFR6]MDN3922616.1 hypothetical protein [Pelomonas sp. PFR6]
MLAAATLPCSSPADQCLSPALQAYLRDCVRQRLQSEGLPPTPWFRIHLYLRLGDMASAQALDRDLRQQAQGGGSLLGLIALFGQLAPDLDIQSALARQLRLMHGCDRQLQLPTPPAEHRLSQVCIGPRRYAVLTLHGQSSRLHCVMPCPMLVFAPLE